MFSKNRFVVKRKIQNQPNWDSTAHFKEIMVVYVKNSFKILVEYPSINSKPFFLLGRGEGAEWIPMLLGFVSFHFQFGYKSPNQTNPIFRSTATARSNLDFQLMEKGFADGILCTDDPLSLVHLLNLKIISASKANHFVSYESQLL